MNVAASEFFMRADALPLAGVEEIAGAGGLVVIAPHPDDESLGCGGLIARALNAGRKVGVVVLSDGRASHPQTPAAEICARREVEAFAACAALGLAPQAVVLLRMADGAVAEAGADGERAVVRIASMAHETAASCLATTWRFDPHADHRAAYALACRARDLLGPGVALREYPIWGHTLAATHMLPTPSGFRLAIDDVLARKTAAVRAHVSQIEPGPDGAVLSPRFIARCLRPFEIFLT